jgi:hypothetical protein
MGGSSELSGDKFTDGHAWLTLHYPNGRHTSVGLWAERDLLELNHLIRDPIGLTQHTQEQFEVNFGLEEKKLYRPKASRYYGLRQGQSTKAIMFIGQYAGWRATYTCATWATEKIEQIFGVELASREFFGFTNTPRALGLALTRLNALSRTSVSNPFYP